VRPRRRRVALADPDPDHAAARVPGLISAGIFAFTLSWNEFIYALTLIGSSENKTVPVGVLTELVRGDVYEWGALMAARSSVAPSRHPLLLLRRALRVLDDGSREGIGCAGGAMRPLKGQSMDRIGFIGVGLMGQGMATNILAKGYPVTVMGHRNRAPVEDLLRRGAREARTARELAGEADVIVLCVTGSSQVEELCLGPDGIAAAGRTGIVVVDCSTSDPVSTKRVAAALGEAGIAFADAPMGGTPANTAAGTASCMVGADSDTFSRVQPILSAFASKVVHLGAVGDGHTMKLLNNFLSMGYAALYSEALALAMKTGIDPVRFDSVIRGSRMDCGFYQTFMTYVLERDPNAHRFTLRNGLKDVTYLEALAQSVGLANPLGNAVKNGFATAVATGRGDLNVPALSDLVAQANGTSLGPEPATIAADKIAAE
jgi:3-hydroxyisobutyrate dehydrogenase-like beta-hydroxyacid dehydrogenase